MKNKNVTLLSLLTLSLSAGFLVGCGSQGGSKYLNNEWYLTGYGSYISGAYHSIEGGLAFKKDETPKEGYKESYTLKDADFQIGDRFYITNKNKKISLNDAFKSDSGSFTTNNVYLLDEAKKDSVDVLKTGKYNVSVLVKDKSVDVLIENGTGTGANTGSGVIENQHISIFANSDYHGAVEEQYNQVGIAKYNALIKQEMDKTDVDDILISNGDLWQGSLASNSNYGKMLNEIIDDMGYDAFVLGNHEFDWEVDNIALNQSLVNVPYLAANVVDYKTKELVDYVQPYTIIERGEAKIGVIGTIGEGQWTSITSKNVQDIQFLDALETCKQYSDILKGRFGCQIVIFSNHAATVATYPTTELGQLSPVTNKKYVDAIIFGHDHIYASGVISPGRLNIPYVNSGNNGRSLGHIDLYIENNQVVDRAAECILTSDLVIEPDTNTQTIVDKYYTDELKEKGASVVANLNGTASKNSEAPRMMARAMYEYAKENGQNVDLAIVNVARDNLYSTVTYADIMDAFPFLNKTVIMKAYGSDIVANAKGNYYYSPNLTDFSSNKKYTIAIYDYMAYHMSYSREYDYFHDFSVVKELNSKFPSDIIADYLGSFSGTVNVSDYTTNNYTYLQQ